MTKQQEDRTPATKADIKRLEESTRADVSTLEKYTKSEFKTLENRIKTLEDSTKADSKRLENAIQALEKRTIARIQASETSLRAEIRYVNQGIDQVLVVLGNIEKRLENRLDNHEERIVSLEESLV